MIGSIFPATQRGPTYSPSRSTDAHLPPRSIDAPTPSRSTDTLTMGKDRGRAASTADDTLICTKITEALTDPALVAAIADRVAAAINSKLNARLDRLEKVTGEQEVRILQLEAKLDDLEQYGRRNLLRISGIEEDVEGEDLPAKVNNVLTVLGLENSVQIDRLHRVGPRPRRDTDRTQKHRSRLVLVKFANYTSRDAVIKTRSSLKEKLPGVYINENLTQPKAKLLYEARKLKKEQADY